MHELRSGIFLLGLSLLVIVESLRAGLGSVRNPGSGFISFCAGVLLAVLSLAIIRNGWKVRNPLKTPFRRVVLAMISLFIYSLVLSRLGFVVATFLLVIVLFRLGEARPWWALLGLSALVTSLVYLVFGIGLHVYFPRSFMGI